jgi:hypothetical protein
MASHDPHSQGRSDPIRELLDEESLADEITKAIKGNDCPEDRELEAYVKKELREPEKIEVKSHLTFCGRCQKRVQSLAGESQPQITRAQGKSFRRYRLPTGAPQRQPLLAWRFMAGGAAVVALTIGAYLFWFGPDSDFPYSIKLLRAAGQTTLNVGQPFSVEVRSPRPLYLIQITIDGEGRIVSSIPPGPREGKFQGGDPLTLTPTAPRELDLYLVPCPDGFPNRLHSGLLEFLKTDTTLSRENQRSGIKMALDLYRARFLHEIYQIKP